MAAAAETLRAALRGRPAASAGEIEALIGKDGGARDRALGRHGARAAVGHVGAPPRGPLRAGRGLDRAAGRRPRTTRSTTSSRRYLTGFGPASQGGHRQLGRARAHATSTPALERLELRRFEAEDGTELLDLPRLPLPDAGHARPGALPADLGRGPARPRAPRADPARGAPRADLPHEDAAVGRHVPRRRRGGRHLAAGGGDRLEPFRRLDAAEREALEAEASAACGEFIADRVR